MDVLNFLQVDSLLQVITNGRLWSVAAGLFGLSGIIIGRIALARSTRNPGSAKLMGIFALLLGMTGMIIGGLNLASSDGSMGKGKGVAGAYVAMALGLIAIIMGWLTMARLRRMGNNRPNIPQ
jgi:hypothetical protein